MNNSKGAPAVKPSSNAILAALSRQCLKRLQPHLEYVPLAAGTFVYVAGRRSAHVYFPTSGVISMLHGIENGAIAEIAVVGNEGLLGMAMFLSDRASRALVKCSGGAYRMSQLAFTEELGRGGELQGLVLRHARAIVAQIVQTAVCNKHHSIDQQFCRTLLMSQDRLASDELAMTQEGISEMLSVRRVGVSAAAGKLRAAGVIRYARGRIILLNRRKLETLVCECYRAVSEDSGRLPGSNDRRLRVRARAPFATQPRARST